MGRIVSPSEHLMNGEVRVGRQLRPCLELPPELQQKRDEALAPVEELKAGVSPGRLTGQAYMNAIEVTGVEVAVESSEQF